MVKLLISLILSLKIQSIKHSTLYKNNRLRTFPSVYESLQHLHMHTLIKSFITECVHISH